MLSRRNPEPPFARQTDNDADGVTPPRPADSLRYMTMRARPILNRRLRGEIAYRGDDGAYLGREYFDLSSHRGGHVLRAQCLLDDARLIRDVTLSMAPDWSPLDGYCRIDRQGHTESIIWFRIGQDGVHVDQSLRGQLLPQQHLPLEAPLPYLGLHPLQGDALIVEQRGTDAPGQYRAVAAVTNSISPNGDEAVGAQRMQIHVAYLGRENISVTAGTFTARHYALRWRDDWPPADLWVRQEDNLFLLMRWPMISTWYELDTWEEQL